MRRGESIEINCQQITLIVSSTNTESGINDTFTKRLHSIANFEPKIHEVTMTHRYLINNISSIEMNCQQITLIISSTNTESGINDTFTKRLHSIANFEPNIHNANVAIYDSYIYISRTIFHLLG
jgi:dimeric dUTPase (all-alpha-NTP-PPase superfamily)